MAERRMPLTAIKSAVREDMVYDVTSHYLDPAKVPGHPCAGTTRRRVTRVNGSSVYMVPVGAPAGEAGRWPAFKWPKADQAEMDPDGTIRLYGGGASQGPGDLFLTLAPVTG
jgi:hypothetical protein